jgi:DNA-binding LacI/PurR family transcriptional regulator
MYDGPMSTRKPGRASRSSAAPSHRRVTLKFLAEHLELSPTTVSVVLTDSPLAATIAQRTKERIWEAAEKFQYRPNMFAQYLQSKRSFSIAVLVPDIGDEYSSSLISGIEAKLKEAGFNYIVASHRGAPEEIENSPETLMDRAVEGMIFINTPLKRRLPIPVVAISDITTAPGVTRIVIDNDRAIALGLSHLHKLGHRRIAFFKGPAHNGDTEMRWKAVLDNAAKLRITLDPSLVVQLGTYPEVNESTMTHHGYAAALTLLKRTRSFTALMAFNDGSAIGAMRAFQDAGLSVPNAVSVVGIDGLPVGEYIYPRLTTVRQPLLQMGELAASTLLSRIQGTNVAEETKVLPELIVRESTAPQRY